jgi:hypothetical protein
MPGSHSQSRDCAHRRTFFLLYSFGPRVRAGGHQQREKHASHPRPPPPSRGVSKCAHIARVSMIVGANLVWGQGGVPKVNLIFPGLHMERTRTPQVPPEPAGIGTTTRGGRRGRGGEQPSKVCSPSSQLLGAWAGSGAEVWCGRLAVRFLRRPLWFCVGYLAAAPMCSSAPLMLTAESSSRSKRA